ncbi:MAG: copper homeostasis protein CutC [Citrobacter sp.]|uniref:copper homeostasis protein CutC n=1 Tax=Citrobacter sp. wls711 TaxID=2576425 RepID=UPI000BBCFFD0|nr:MULTISPECIES: copper homeostasis protein CutC [Citrobacter]MBP8253771.1 copper homeostasis protein CutC [Citrobacter sp.]HEE0107985.1 copper homeostasis protein CutC [Citrobacter gillenii]ATF49932.1 copper homeostasis protein CutC [Citrobacter werkmanii]TKU58984.1 copper homeostasis protein CutC [Citrobacter sp. wls711]HEE0121348.1 copper homeostasis protein CutC [Citrobacter gillenii]
MALLEICCYSMECALTAQKNGADRIELCSAPKEGGLTPSLGVLRTVRQQIDIPVNPIIRPRGGDFCYTDGEFAAMLDDIAMVRDLGFSGLVTGLLDVDGNVDMSRMEKIVRAAGTLNVTFHRAFDMCANPLNALKNLSDLGVARVLTSGQKSDAAQGLTKIMELIAQPGAPIIMAGAGVRAANLSLFLDAGVQEVHSSAGVWLASPMRYRNAGLSMSSDTQADEYSRYAVDGAAVAEMKAIIAHHRAS